MWDISDVKSAEGKQELQVSKDDDNDAFLECLESIRVSVPMSSPAFRSLLGLERELPSLGVENGTNENKSLNRPSGNDYSSEIEKCNGPKVTYFNDADIHTLEKAPEAENDTCTSRPTMQYDETCHPKDTTELRPEKLVNTDSEIENDGDSCLVSNNGFSYSPEEISYLDNLAKVMVDHLAKSLALDFYPPKAVESVFGIQQSNPVTPHSLAECAIGQVMLGVWRTLYIQPRNSDMFLLEPLSVFDKDKVIKALREGNLPQQFKKWIYEDLPNGSHTSYYTLELEKRGFDNIIWDKVMHDKLRGVGPDGRKFPPDKEHTEKFPLDNKCAQKNKPSHTGSKICVVCGQTGNKICSQCKKRQYCGEYCQSKDWKTHKDVCKKIKATM